jgi:hypothetical protein
MRCCLKSYLRFVSDISVALSLFLSLVTDQRGPASVLDPILFILLNPAIMHQTTSVKVSDVSIEIVQYCRPFDQARIQHVLENLLSVVRFGGQGFTRVAKGSETRQTPDEALRKRLEAGKGSRLSSQDLELRTYFSVVWAESLDGETYLDALCRILVR